MSPCLAAKQLKGEISDMTGMLSYGNRQNLTATYQDAVNCC